MKKQGFFVNFVIGGISIEGVQAPCVTPLATPMILR